MTDRIDPTLRAANDELARLNALVAKLENEHERCDENYLTMESAWRREVARRRMVLAVVDGVAPRAANQMHLSEEEWLRAEVYRVTQLPEAEILNY